MTKVRCAIYTRKSSEEGLEQDFNSLHAQREACAAYVASQASEGWVLSGEVYDDGGISGGTLERPALQRLLSDIAEGRIDIVVVYKVDRLTRSLLDFSKLVEAFDKAGVSFVSITQSFNTTTSMGRLTLNMLLSFAQFEREVTAERIRDKIAASKAKGMWMGGTPPLGYKANGRSLAIVEAEAELLRHIFAQYLKLGSVRTLAEALKREGIVSPLRTFASGRTRGGTVMTRGQLYHLLGNPIYIGRIRHHDKTYAGLHEGLVDQDTWDAVQQLLADNTQGTARRRAAGPSLLAGLIYDEMGEPLIASHASKAAPGQTSGGKTRYRYYCSKPVHNGSSPNKPSTRIPAKDIEHLVRIKLGEALADPLSLALELQAPLEQALPGAASGPLAQLAGKVQGRDHETLRRLIAKVQVLPAEVRIDLDAAALAQELGWTIPAEVTTLRLTSEVKLARTGMARRMVFEDGRAAEAPTAKPTLIRLLVRARSWWKQLAAGELTREELARQEGVIPSYVSRVVKLAFLSPRVVETILAGTHPAALDAGALLAPGLSASWREQERKFLGRNA